MHMIHIICKVIPNIQSTTFVIIFSGKKQIFTEVLFLFSIIHKNNNK